MRERFKGANRLKGIDYIKKCRRNQQGQMQRGGKEEAFKLGLGGNERRERELGRCESLIQLEINFTFKVIPKRVAEVRGSS